MIGIDMMDVDMGWRGDEVVWAKTVESKGSKGTNLFLDDPFVRACGAYPGSSALPPFRSITLGQHHPNTLVSPRGNNWAARLPA
jgi:hypothetical protein